jgi:prepilin-type N-terminal cleavage/methylation domain-containing protein
MARLSLLARHKAATKPPVYSPGAKYALDCGHRETASGFFHPSSFILHPSSLIAHPSSFRRGVTLVEMLVVISIIVILTVASLKLIAPGEERRVREAARAVNVYISSARSRAIEIGRPCGVIFHRANGTNFPTASTVLDQCEVPPPYAGDTTDAVVKVMLVGLSPPTLKIQIRQNDFSNNLIRPGDLIQFNSQGPFYNIALPDLTGTTPDFPPDGNGYIDFSTGTASTAPWIDSNNLTVTLSSDTPIQALPWSGAWSAPVAFKILRQPEKSSASPLQLPAGAVVDLDFSGTDYRTFQNPQNPPGTNIDVKVIFSPNGSVEGYYWNNQPYPALGPIYMLVGSRSRVRDFRVAAQQLSANPNLNDLPNWADLSSVWVTINYQTGMAMSDENCAINFATEKDQNPSHNQLIPWDKMIGPAPEYYPNWAYFINLSRTYARQSQSMGGR